MASTVYTDFQTPAVNAAWLNDVNRVVYDVLGNPNVPGDLPSSVDVVNSADLSVSGQDLTITLGRTGTAPDLSDTVTLPAGGGGGNPGDLGIDSLNVLVTAGGTLTRTAVTATTDWSILSNNNGLSAGLATDGTTIWNLAGGNRLFSPTLDEVTGVATNGPELADFPSSLGQTLAYENGRLYATVNATDSVRRIDTTNFQLSASTRSFLPAGINFIGNTKIWGGNGFFWTSIEGVIYQFDDDFVYTGQFFTPELEDGNTVRAAAWNGQFFWALIRGTESRIQAFSTDWAPSGVSIPVSSSSFADLTYFNGLLLSTTNTYSGTTSSLNRLELENMGLVVEAGSEMLILTPQMSEFIPVTQVVNDDVILSDTTTVIPASQTGNIFRKNAIGDVLTAVRVSPDIIFAPRGAS